MEPGERAVSVVKYIASARSWFESFQHWRGEVLSVGVLVVFGIFLRERGSPESKPVAAAYSETGTG